MTDILTLMARAHYENYFEPVADLHLKWHDQPESHLDRLRESMRAALRALNDAGWKCVPKEPTSQMEVAGAIARDFDHVKTPSRKRAYYVYKDMIAAAPAIDGGE